MPGTASGVPTIWLRSWVGRPETCPSVVIGIAIAPNATGAVSATSATEAARIGDSPMPISITPQIATGVPNPASASSSAPKQNAITTTCTRMSSETVGESSLEHREVPCDVGHVVDPQGVDDDPHDRPEAERGAFERRIAGLPDRHAVNRHGDDDRDSQRDQRSPLRLHPDDPQQHEQHHQGQESKDRRRIPANGIRGRVPAYTPEPPSRDDGFGPSVTRLAPS